MTRRAKTRKTITIASAACAPLSMAAITLATAATAVAADPTVAGFGTREQLFDANGAAVTGWSISELKSSSDAIPYAVSGRLYEVTAAVDAVQGTVTPMVSNFNARATDGATYRALFNVATPQDIDASAVPPGAKSTGKIYFDVTGAVPNSVVYNDGAQDLLIWTGAAPSPAAPVPAPPPAITPAPAAPAAASPPATPAPSTPAATPAASGSMPSGTTPAGATGQSSASTGSMPSGTTPAGGSTTGVTGIAPGSAGPGGNPAGKT